MGFDLLFIFCLFHKAAPEGHLVRVLHVHNGLQAAQPLLHILHQLPALLLLPGGRPLQRLSGQKRGRSPLTFVKSLQPKVKNRNSRPEPCPMHRSARASTCLPCQRAGTLSAGLPCQHLPASPAGSKLICDNRCMACLRAISDCQHRKVRQLSVQRVSNLAFLILDQAERWWPTLSTWAMVSAALLASSAMALQGLRCGMRSLNWMASSLLCTLRM